jgi:putative peptide zinc metalloprotease protein
MAEPFLSSAWFKVGALKPRLRPNLSVSRQRVRGDAWYVVHDPAGGKTYRFTPAVYSVIGAMDGQRTMDEIWREACERLGADAPGQTAVVSLLSQLHNADLLLAGVTSDPAEMARRFSRAKRKDWMGRYLNPMSIRIRIADPDRFLERTLPLARPFFSVLGVMLWAVALFWAGLALAPRAGELTGNLADRVLSAEGLLMAALVFPALKLLHELAHGYAAKAGGAEVHEMGVMFVALMPVPYVDASASSAFRSKWRRAGVAAAGMMAELLAAAVAAAVWLNVEPGLLRAAAFNVMLIAGVSTVMFNGNPLLKLDGYFIFSDLIEVPNLAQRANRFWGWLVEAKLFRAGVERPASTPGERAWFVFYAPAAFAYRMAVLFTIALFLASEWFVLGVAIAIIGVALGVGLPILKAGWHVATSPRLQRVRRRAVVAAILGVGGLAALLFLVPAPLRTVTEGVVWLPEDAYVRAGGNGLIRAVSAPSGARVAVGDSLVLAEDPLLKAEEAVLEAQIAALAARFDSEQFADRIKAAVTMQEIAVKREALGRLRERLDALEVRASSPGVLEMPREANLPGRWVKRGDVLGYVIGQQPPILRVVVPQSDIDLVRQRLASSEMLAPGQLWRPVPLTLLREVPAATDRLPSRALAVDGGGRVAVDARNPKAVRSLDRWFQLDFAIPAGAAPGGFEGRAYVRFDHGWEPLGQQLWRRGRQMFLSRLNA